MNSEIHNKLENLCRTCLIKIENVEKAERIENEMYDKLMQCTSVYVDTNILPNWLCIECINLIQIFNKFRIQCTIIENSLKELNAEINIEKVDFLIENIHKTILKKNCEPAVIVDTPNIEKQCSSNSKFDIISNSDNETDSLISEGSKSEINLEIGQNQKKKIQCNICKKQLSSTFSLHRHKQTHNKSRKFTHKCAKCGKGFYEKSNYIKHIRRHEEKLYSCKECSKKYYDLPALLKHIKLHHNLKPKLECEICGEKFILLAQLDQHLKIHTVHKCSHCDKQFSHESLVKRHLLSHSNDKPYKCSLCDKSFKQSISLEVHTKKHNGIVNKEICTVCGLSFVNIRMHMMKHTTNRPHKCTECGKGLRTKVHLREHMRKHTGEKRIPNILCIVCGKKLLDSSKMRAHMRKHTGERPFVCSICNKSFTMKYALTVHTRTHTNNKQYICHICGKEFKADSSLKIHSRVHSGVKPYPCSICDKKFTQSGSLKTHMKIHLNDKAISS